MKIATKMKILCDNLIYFLNSMHLTVVFALMIAQICMQLTDIYVSKQ